MESRQPVMGNAERRRDQHERRIDTATGDFQRRQSAERTTNDRRGDLSFRFRKLRARPSRSKSSLSNDGTFRSGVVSSMPSRSSRGRNSSILPLRAVTTRSRANKGSAAPRRFSHYNHGSVPKCDRRRGAVVRIDCARTAVPIPCLLGRDVSTRRSERTPPSIASSPHAVRANANAIFAQVRRRGDAWYLDAREPLTETDGVGEPERPAARRSIRFATSSRKRTRGIEVHAFTIVGSIFSGDPRKAMPRDPTHPFVQHVANIDATSPAQWATRALPPRNAGTSFDGQRFGTEWYIDLGHPEAAAYTVNVLAHLVAQIRSRRIAPRSHPLPGSAARAARRHQRRLQRHERRTVPRSRRRHRRIRRRRLSAAERSAVERLAPRTGHRISPPPLPHRQIDPAFSRESPRPRSATAPARPRTAAFSTPKRISAYFRMARLGGGRDHRHPRADELQARAARRAGEAVR